MNRTPTHEHVREYVGKSIYELWEEKGALLAKGFIDGWKRGYKAALDEAWADNPANPTRQQ